MKEVLSIAANNLASFNEKGLVPMVEVILVLSEPSYTLDATGDQIRSRATSQERFVASVDNLRKLSRILSGLADDSEAAFTAASSIQKEAK